MLSAGAVPLQNLFCSGTFYVPRPTFCYFGFTLGKRIAYNVRAAEKNITNVVMKEKRGTVFNINSSHKCRHVYTPTLHEVKYTTARTI